MESQGIFSLIAELWGSVRTLDWTAFLLWWLGIEKAIKVIAKITPWKWDDDLVEVISKSVTGVVNSIKKTPDA